jgi:hypothetical protein
LFFGIVWQGRAVKTETRLDSTHRLVITNAMRKAAGIKPGQTLQVEASPGYLLISTPTVPAKLVKRGKLKVIDAAKPDMTVEEAVNRARHYTR